jgi:RNB domain
MSLTAQTDSFALSLGVELADDGAVIDSSIVVTSSIVNVDYRLTYQDVDEMLADGVAYREEWELGALFDAATKRRQYRIHNGSAEGLIPKQVPQYTISAFRDSRQADGIGISISVDVSHNGGLNQSAVVEGASQEQPKYETPVSSASVLVTGALKFGLCFACCPLCHSLF